MATPLPDRSRRLVRLFAELAVLPHRLYYQLLRLAVGAPSACMWVSESAARWTGGLGIYLRRALLPHLVAHFGEQVTIATGSVLTSPNVRIGDHVYIGRGCILGHTTIGADTLISDQVRVVSGQHGLAPDQLIRQQPDMFTTISIGSDCWIGTAAIILADVGDHAVVGAGSVVTKPVAPYAIVVGNPARPIGDRRERTPA